MKKIFKNEEGFTLVELVVTILVIGILSAIAVPIFLNQQKTSAQAGVQMDLSNMYVAATNEKIDGKFKTYAPEDSWIENCQSEGVRCPGDFILTKGVQVRVSSTSNASNLCIEARHSSTVEDEYVIKTSRQQVEIVNEGNGC